MMRRSGLRWRAALLLAWAVLGAHWALLRVAAPVFAPGARDPVPASLQWRTVPSAAPATSPPPAAPPHNDRAPPRRASVPPPSPAAAPAARATAPAAPAQADPAAMAAVPEPAPETALRPAGRALAVALPGAATLHYRVTASTGGAEVHGQAQLQWRHDGSQYEARLEIGLPGRPVRIQRSTGAITPQGLAPIRFSERTRSEEAAHFDRAAQRIVFSTNRPEQPLAAGAQDRLSVLLQLSALVAGEPSRYPVGSTVQLQTAGTREADAWRFTIDAQELLPLPGGTLDAVRLVRAVSREHEPLLELWLGPGPDYAPVRLRLTLPGGDWLDLQWSGTDRG